MRYDVLIVGAGPTGLVLALWLTKFGVKVRIVDRAEAPGTTSRALMVQARTLELYRQLDLADVVVESAHKVQAFNLWARGMRKARIPFEDVGVGLTPYPYVRIFAQDQHERLLISRLEAKGIFIDRQTEVVAWTDHGDRVEARLRHPRRGEEWCEADYIAGCDGARSIVREALGVGFPGGARQHVFYVADLQASGPSIDGELHVDLDEPEFLAIFPLAGGGRARLLGKLKGEVAAVAEALRFEDVSERAIRSLRLQVAKTNWFSTHRVHHRVADRFRMGRAFLLGDAAHIDSPAGGQGMNTGIGDAINLAWKLKAVLRAEAPETLLDSYESERIGFARKLVATTDKAFTVATAVGGFADFARLWLVPDTLSGVFAFHAAKELAFRTVSQINVHYRGGPLSEGKAGGVHGGDRLPWVAMDDNHASLSDPTWQVHLYGEARPELSAWCAERRLPLRIFPWKSPYAEAGLTRNAAYLIRPDAYVALADSRGATERLHRYFESRGLSI
jgi:2-polyprenyl-6-methoxyphenol hydroxylase-like FAD-dependent oxidoreductase